MASIGGGAGGEGDALELDEFIDQGWAKLNDYLMEMTELGRTISGETGKIAKETAYDPKEMHRVADRMNAAVCGMLEVVDDTFRSVLKRVAVRTVDATPAAPLPVNALDAYLEGAAISMDKASRGIQTDRESSASESSAVVTRQAIATKWFDLLRGRVRSDMKPKLEVKSETEKMANGSHARSHKKKRIRSSDDSGSDHDPSNKKREYYHVPKKQIEDRRALRVIDVRERASQREYLVEFEHLDEPIWLASRRAPPAVKRLIRAFSKGVGQRARRKAEQEARETGAGGAVQVKAVSDEVYIVDKIVDHRFRLGKKQYLVKWDGYDTDENTWEPAAKLRTEVRDIVDEYERELAKTSSRQSSHHAGAATSASLSSIVSVHSRSEKVIATMVTSKRGATVASRSPPSFPSKTLQRSGKIPRRHFSTSEDDEDDEDEENDILRLAGSDNDTSDDDRESMDWGITDDNAEPTGFRVLAPRRSSREPSPAVE